MNLQHNSEEPQQDYTASVSDERKGLETSATSDKSATRPIYPERLRKTQLGRRRSLSGISLRVQNGIALEEKHFFTLFQHLQNPSASRWKERMLASWVIGNTPLTEERTLQAIEALGETVERIHKQDRLLATGRFFGRSVGMMVALFGISIASGKQTTGFGRVFSDYFAFWGKAIFESGGLPSGAEGLPYEHQILYMLCVLFLFSIVVTAPFSLPFSLGLDRARQSRVRKEAALSLSNLGRVEALPYLLAAIRGAKGDLQTALLDAIAALLPRLSVEDYGRFRSDTVPNLCHLLERHPGDSQLRILVAIRLIGDSRAIETVKGLAESSPSSEVRERAREILPILEARKAQEYNAQNLLRASQEPLAEEELLRPAYAVADTETDTLLRPSIAPPHDLPRYVVQQTIDNGNHHEGQNSGD